MKLYVMDRDCQEMSVCVPTGKVRHVENRHDRSGRSGHRQAKLDVCDSKGDQGVWFAERTTTVVRAAFVDPSERAGDVCRRIRGICFHKPRRYSGVPGSQILATIRR